MCTRSISCRVLCRCSNPERNGYMCHVNPLRTGHIIAAKQSTDKPCTYCMGYFIFSTQFSSWSVNPSSYILHLNEAQPGCLQVVRRVATLSRRGLTICRSIRDVSVINKIPHYNICVLICIKLSDRSNFKGVLAALASKRCNHFSTKSRAIESSQNLMTT